MTRAFLHFGVTRFTLLDYLVAYWPLEDDESDATGNGFTLTNNNAVTFDGESASFSAASSQSLSIANASLGDLDVAGQFTLSCWARWSTNWTNAERFIAGIFGDYEIHAYDNFITPSPRVRVQITNNTQIESTNLSNNTWYHVCYINSVAEDRRQVFLNGTAILDSTGASVPIGAGSNNFTIGANSNLSSGFWDGNIKHVGVWNRAILAADVPTLYGSGTPPAYPFI